MWGDNLEGIKKSKSITSYRLSQDKKDRLRQQLMDLDIKSEQYFNKVVSAIEMENLKQNSFSNNHKDLTIIESNLDAIFNSFISIVESNNTLINNKDAELVGLKSKYEDMLLSKEICITEHKKKLEEIYINLNLIQIENENYKNELLIFRKL